MAAAAVTALATVLLWLLRAAQACSTEHALVGQMFPIVTIQHQARGHVKILDDCSFQVLQLELVEGSSVFFWGAAGTTPEELFVGGRVSEYRIFGHYAGSTIQATLTDGITWDDFNVLSIWDEDYQGDFGHAVLRGSGANAEVLQLRWTLAEPGSIDIGLEGIAPDGSYLAFGFADPQREHQWMLGADVTVTGFYKGTPMAVDFALTDYDDCNPDASGQLQGVCPDSVLDGNPASDSSQLLYAHQLFGVTLVRFRRPVLYSRSEPKGLDVDILPDIEQNMVFALGQLQEATVASQALVLPMMHGDHKGIDRGVARIRLGRPDDPPIHDCQLLDVSNTWSVTTMRGVTTFTVDSNVRGTYPNPPAPGTRSFHINGFETPVLEVVRGTQYTFNVTSSESFVLTSHPVNPSLGTVYAGDEHTHASGQQAVTLTWTPDAATPDRLFYNSFDQDKMGWLVRVVNSPSPLPSPGPLDEYPNQATLQGGHVKMGWKFKGDRMYIGVTFNQRAQWLSIAFGNAMPDSWAYVGWIDGNGVGNIELYYLAGHHPDDVLIRDGHVANKRVTMTETSLTIEFSKPFMPLHELQPGNEVDLNGSLSVLWAYGDSWQTGSLSKTNEHTRNSGAPTIVDLQTGEARVVPVTLWLLHGLGMFTAWGVLGLGGVASARYLKAKPDALWFKLHQRMLYSAVAVFLVALVLAVIAAGDSQFDSFHTYWGISAVALGVLQPVNALFRPPAPKGGDEKTNKRHIWEWLHKISGRTALTCAMVALLTGIAMLPEIGYSGLAIPATLHLVVALAVVIYLEVKQRRALTVCMPADTDGDKSESSELLVASRAPSLTEQRHKSIELTPDV
eukprot:jgi/Chlat1/4054/Chrsp26S04000